MAKTIVIDVEEEYSFDIVGIASPLKDYRFVFYLNKALSFSFERKNMLQFKFKTIESEHSFYSYYDDLNEADFICVSNKSDKLIISPEYKQMDYLLLIQSENGADFLKEIVKKIRSQKQIVMASVLNTDSIKLYKNLCYEVELHLNNK